MLTGSDLDAELLVVLAGPAARPVLEGREGGPDGYWPRVWALRGLFHVWDDSAAGPVVAATRDPSWRVREMALRVIRHHAVDDGLAAAVALVADPTARVGVAARRAVEALAGDRSAGPRDSSAI